MPFHKLNYYCKSVKTKCVYASYNVLIENHVKIQTLLDVKSRTDDEVAAASNASKN